MAKINPCFRRIFVFFNVLFAIFGAVVLGLGLLVHLQLDEHESKLSAVVVLVVFGAVTFILAVLGAYGAQKENKNVLIAFFVFMCVGTIALLRMAIVMAISRPEVTSVMKQELNKAVPLDAASEDVKNAMDYIQKQVKCCGLFNGYQDWGNQVPESCDCGSDEADQCQKMTPRNTYLKIFEVRSRMVYSQPCGFMMLQYISLVFDVTLGVLFGFATLALLGGVMSLAMIICITAIPRPKCISSPPIFSVSPHPPKYSELIQSA
ncbi:tetraspanin-8-like [Colossoma macropomum]|uniref:tetraspanin-8-like n=1 Tax=Colossoma macropomum TaxID=42526 RepID=UPI001863EDA2|nr:tetraspanin-8-like [Colossoma macropomum]